MRYRRPAVEVDAHRWFKNGDHPRDNVGEMVDDPMGGAPYARLEGAVVRFFRHPQFPGDEVHFCGHTWHDHGWIDHGAHGLTVCPGDWVVSGEHSTWEVMPPAEFDGRGYKPAYRDRTDHYVPEGLYLDGRPRLAEISAPVGWITPEWLRQMIETAATLLTGAGTRLTDAGQDVEPIRRWLQTLEDYETRDQPPRVARVAHGDPDEHNRDHGSWVWADVSGDGTHWARFGGHRVQVDVELHTSNSRETNDWKGRDEVRPGLEWVIKLNRQVVYGDGFGGTDVPAALRKVERKLSKLLGDSGDRCGLDLLSDVPFAEQLVGKRIYYDKTPAVITSTVLSQGCVMLEPVGVMAFPRSAYELDDEPDGTGHDEQDLYDEGENRSIKVHLDSPLIWWSRRRPYGADEPDERYRSRPGPGPVPGIMVETSPDGDEQVKTPSNPEENRP